MGHFDFVNHWWNLPFLVMLGLVGVFFVLQLIGLAGHGDGDVDAEADADVDADGDVDADSDVDADADHDVDADADADGGLGWSDVLSFFGVGRVPFMVIWITFFLFAGFGGITANDVLYIRAEGDYQGWWFVPVLLVSIIVGLVAVRLFAQIAGRFVDTGGRGSTAKHELAGKVGVVASAQVDARFGEIRVHDERGNELLVHARTRGDDAAILRGARVVLVDFDAKDELFWVTPFPDLPDLDSSLTGKSGN